MSTNLDTPWIGGNVREGESAGQRDPLDDLAQVGLSDLDLLADALQQALNARRDGLVIGQELDEVALRAAEHRARRADADRASRYVVSGLAA